MQSSLNQGFSLMILTERQQYICIYLQSTNQNHKKKGIPRKIDFLMRSAGHNNGRKTNTKIYVILSSDIEHDWLMCVWLS